MGTLKWQLSDAVCYVYDILINERDFSYVQLDEREGSA